MVTLCMLILRLYDCILLCVLFISNIHCCASYITIKDYLLTYLFTSRQIDNSPNALLCSFHLCQWWLYTEDNKDKDGKKPAAAAGTMATTTPVVTSRQPAVDVSKWTTSDVQTWLRENNIQHLQKWYERVAMLHWLWGTTACRCFQLKRPEFFFSSLPRVYENQPENVGLNTGIFVLQNVCQTVHVCNMRTCPRSNIFFIVFLFNCLV